MTLVSGSMTMLGCVSLNRSDGKVNAGRGLPSSLCSAIVTTSSRFTSGRLCPERARPSPRLDPHGHGGR